MEIILSCKWNGNINGNYIITNHSGNYIVIQITTV